MTQSAVARFEAGGRTLRDVVAPVPVTCAELVKVTGGQPPTSLDQATGRGRQATTSLADAKRLSELVSAVQGTWERVTITKNDKPVAVLMAVEDLESLVETLEILSDPEAMAAIVEDRSGTGELTTGQEMAAILAKRSGRGAA